MEAALLQHRRTEVPTLTLDCSPSVLLLVISLFSSNQLEATISTLNCEAEPGLTRPFLSARHSSKAEVGSPVSTTQLQ